MTNVDEHNFTQNISLDLYQLSEKMDVDIAFSIFNEKQKLECGPMPNLMVALPNTGGALCSTPQSLADAH